MLLFKLATFAMAIGLMLLAIRFAMGTLQSALTPVATPRPAVGASALPAPSGSPRLMYSAGKTPIGTAAAPVTQRAPTAAEIRESQRKADEAIRVIEATTPEM